MMRSLFSGVAGLKTHQTRMDVIGNNIANVNTVAYKSSSVTFQDLLYQTTQNASGPNAATQRAGINAKQIGLGVSTGSISTSIATGGSAESTGNPFDIRINGSSFFVVSDGSNQFYTRAGAFNVDANGTLCMSSNGYTIKGYGTTTSTEGDVVIDTSSLKSLTIMSEENMTSDPMQSSRAYISGILDQNSEALTTATGQVVTMPFYDSLGYSYTAQYSITPAKDATGAVIPHVFYLQMTDVFDSDGKSILKTVSGTGDDAETVEMSTNQKKAALLDVMPVQKITFDAATGEIDQMGACTATTTETTDPDTGEKTITITITDPTTMEKAIDSETGQANVRLKLSALSTATVPNNTTFAKAKSPLDNGEGQKIDLDLAGIKNIDNSGTSTVNGGKGMLNSTEGAGWKVGDLSSISIGVDGRITGVYTNGQTKLLGQIAVATFANASGLEKAGDNLYASTMNSGDPVIGDITADGGSMATGELEMSNVDLSSEFTTMITTQRGFQANSRIITVSDTLLEELINLKR